MVDNGYKLNISEMGIYDFVTRLRNEFQMVQMDLLNKLMAQEIERVQDLVFINGIKLDKSIFDKAKERVKSRIEGVKSGIYIDADFDLRSSINIIKHNDSIFAIFNTVNLSLKQYFESLPEVEQYKFFIAGDTAEVQENIEAGEFWHEQFENSNWNKLMIGVSAQITVQPNIDNITFEMKNISDCYIEPEIRADKYIKTMIMKNHAAELIGNVPIEEIDPLMLTEFFMKSYEYLSTDEAKNKYQEIYKDIRKGFLKVEQSNIL